MGGTDIIGIVLVAMLGFILWQVRRQQGDLKTALYKNGITVYVTKTEWKDAHSEFQASVCDKVDDIKSIIKDMNDRRDVARKDDALWKEAMSRSLGRIEGTLSKKG